LQSQVSTGRIRCIAVTSEKGIGGVPSLKEQGIDLAIGNWRGIVGSPGMSAQGRQAWLSRLDRMAQTKEWAEGLERTGLENAYLSGEAFAAFLKDENARWATVLKDVGIAK